MGVESTYEYMDNLSAIQQGQFSMCMSLVILQLLGSPNNATRSLQNCMQIQTAISNSILMTTGTACPAHMVTRPHT